MMKKIYYLFAFSILVCSFFIYSNYRENRKRLQSALEVSYQLDSLNNVQFEQANKSVNAIRKKAMNTLDQSDLRISKNTLQLRAEMSRLKNTLDAIQNGLSSPQGDNRSLRDSLGLFISRYEKVKLFTDSISRYLKVSDYDELLNNSNLNDSKERNFIKITTVESRLMELYIDIMDEQRSFVGAGEVEVQVIPPMFPVDPLYHDLKDTLTNGESYKIIDEVPYSIVRAMPVSTFSIDVDIASYSNIRRYLNEGIFPIKDAVKTEEIVNYFDYDYPDPVGRHPVSLLTEVSECPWDSDHQLLMVGMKGKDLNKELKNFESLPPNNLTFLIDVSGSMQYEKSLPLLKNAMKLLVQQLRPVDKVAIVVYADATGLVLPATSGDNKKAILQAIDSLNAGGSTNGGAGIKLAYEIAKKNFIKKGNNRIILATDGDFNVGVSSDDEMFNLVEEYRKSGVYITCLGFGSGNYQGSKLESIANAGNGNYAYIDSQNEADYVLGSGFSKTLYTIADDVKIQIEFNPRLVQSYRLIGYENRTLHFNDFKNDRKDAGDLGSGFTVTALYEIVVEDSLSASSTSGIKNLKYFKKRNYELEELATIKFRYKKPGSKRSREVVHEIELLEQQNQPSKNFILSSAAASFSLLLRDSPYKGNATYQNVISQVLSVPGITKDEKWTEFIGLVGKAEEISNELEF